MTAPPVIEMRQLAVTYRKGPPWQRTAMPALKGVSLAIAAGETLGLVGESGSGKSTLGRVALGLVQPSQGSVLFDGRPLDEALRRSGALSVVFQHPEWALNPRLRCGTSMAEPLHIQRRCSPAERAAAVSQMLEQVGLDAALAQRYPSELSGGQRQRMAIARALITRPRFIVFDEAVSDLAATRYVAHHIGVLLRGELVETGPASRFYAQPEHPYSRELYATLD
jgi:ABC-type glutathione transport system ATPase component